MRWYCQLCEKQCRDENGFKCHCVSESHLRRVQIFGSNPTRAIDDYSTQFERNFLQHLQSTYRSSRVEVNKVYNELISFKSHVHMNATRWTTLSDFIRHLSTRSDCVVEETSKGWFITCTTTEPDGIDSRRRQSKRALETAVDSRLEKVIASQAVGSNSHEVQNTSPTKIQRSEKVDSFVLKARQVKSSSQAQPSFSGLQSTGRVTNIDNLESEMWLRRGLVVKVKCRKDLGKGIVDHVHDGKSVASVNFSGTMINVHQSELEKILPRIGAKVCIVAGQCVGQAATLLSVDTARRKAKIRILDTSVDEEVDFGQICKVQQI